MRVQFIGKKMFPDIVQIQCVKHLYRDLISINIYFAFFSLMVQIQRVKQLYRDLISINIYFTLFSI